MDNCCKKVKNVCCRDEEKMVRYALSALEKLQDIVGQTLNTAVKPDICAPVHPFRETRVLPKVPREFCKRLGGPPEKRRPKCRPDRDAMRLLPGQVGLHGDRAVFHLGPTAHEKAAAAGGRRPTNRDREASAVYYSLVPGAAERREAERRAAERREAKRREAEERRAAAKLRAGDRGVVDDNNVGGGVVDENGVGGGVVDDNGVGGGDVDADDSDGDVDGEPVWRPKDRLMRIMPSLPAPRGVAVGPVTGLPVAGDDHVFVLRVEKRYHDKEDKARLEMEVRLPKYRSPVMTSAGTQCVAEPEKPKKDGKEKIKKKKKNKKDKKKTTGGKKKKTTTGGKKKAADKKKVAGEKKVTGKKGA